MKNYYIILVTILISFLFVSCSVFDGNGENETIETMVKEPQSEDEIQSQDEPNTIELVDETNDETITTPNIDSEEVIREAFVEEVLASMTLEEKVAQLFIVDFYTFNNYKDITSMTDELELKFGNYPVGGVIYFSSNVVDREQVINLNVDLQNSVSIPMFIAVDEEGGIVRRLGSNELMQMTEIPTASVIGETLDYDWAYDLGKTLGIELRELGFNMDFAPVADVNTNSDNPVIGDRAFSDDEEVVAQMVASMVNGLQEENVAAVAKHFPGHGDTSTDTHSGDVYVEHDMERLEAIELVPFQKAIDEDIMAIMTAHIILPNITENDEPATVSYEILSELLRQDMNYNGLIITDSFAMGAITKRYDPGEAAIMAIEAGVDIILMPKDFEMAYNAIVDAVNNDIITDERIDESVRRILLSKYKLELFK